MPVTRILHGAGNIRDADLGSLARHPAVDAIEADVWVHGDRLIAHHERPIGVLGLLAGRGGFRRRSGAVSLRQILDATAGGPDVVIDLRSWFGDPAPDLARAVDGEADRARIRVTCEDWALADRVRAWLPGVRVGYSVRSERQLRAYLAARDAGRLPETAVAIRHTLLHTPDEVALVRERAGRVGAWTVDDVDRAMELAAWGVDEITSNHVTVLNAL
ncbi:MAG: hypothetical protein WC273_03915 [Dehalococcoidia bacterium]